MDGYDRPDILCLACWFSPAVGPTGGRNEHKHDTVPPDRAWPRVVTLSQAVVLKAQGAAVLVDPETEAALARWEQTMRVQDLQKKWFSRD